MWVKFIFIILFVSILTSELAFAQKKPTKKDSNSLYKNNESFSVRSKFTKFMYRLLFRPGATSPPQKNVKKNVKKKRIQKPYSTFQGKTIRNINIEVLDPFGYSIADTIVATLNIITKTGNKFHVKTRPSTIRNLLLIRKNQLFDSLLFKESERLVRSRKYIIDVSFFVVATAKKSDSVDVYIRELDNWSIIPKIETSFNELYFNLTDKNFLGLGHEFQNVFTRNYTGGYNTFNTNYTIPNIRNTFINTTLHYGFDGHNNFNRSITIDRPFFSPFAEWAGGVNFAQLFRRDSIWKGYPHFVPQRIKLNEQDYWVGKATQIFDGNTENDRTTKFISALRYLRIRYPEKPIEAFDSLHIFSNEDFYLAGIAIATRKYVQDKFIFNYGITEDVPVGKVYGLTFGYQEKNNTGRLYVGARISIGNYYPWGYLSSNYEFGTFFRASRTEQGIFSLGVTYFTELAEIGKWKFRQFVKPQFTIGINRFSSDSLTINDRHGLDGFYSSELSGTNRLLFTLQTQSYAPWNFIGFRFGPYLVYTLGMLGDAAKGFGNSRVYSQIGLGVLIKNINLVINTFQISIAFYPLIPGIGRDVFKFDPFNTTQFGFKDFEFGKPATIAFE